MTNVSIYETALQEHGLDYYVVGGRAFFAQQEVFDLYHLLRAWRTRKTVYHSRQHCVRRLDA